jgi:uncharacterized protein YcsI (UPF0317 family)
VARRLCETVDVHMKGMPCATIEKGVFTEKGIRTPLPNWGMVMKLKDTIIGTKAISDEWFEEAVSFIMRYIITVLLT